MNFKNLGLAEPIVRAVAREGYTTPTPIQAQSIPHVLTGRDVLGCAQTGTGKTAAFTLPLLHRLSAPPARGGANGRRRVTDAKRGLARALILAPTRELASQIGTSVRTYGDGLHLRHATIYGGVNQNPQVRALREGVDILIATPGRLLDLMNQGHVDLSAVEFLVLDEADRMLDMGFMPDIRRIEARLPKSRQTLLFSATMPADIRALAASMLRDPVNVQVDPVSSTVRTVSQSVYHVSKQGKPILLESILQGEGAGRTLVFTRTKHGADRVVKALLKSGIRAAAIHGNKSQNARTRALEAFRLNAPPVLVATDIAARGIDVDDINHVINFDLPNEPETYVHRIGRTARAGASGAAISFCDSGERSFLRAIERLTGVKITVRRSDLPDAANGGDAQAAAAGERRGNRSAALPVRRMSKKEYHQSRAARSSESRSASQSDRRTRSSKDASKGAARNTRRFKRARRGTGATASHGAHRTASS